MKNYTIEDYQRSVKLKINKLHLFIADIDISLRLIKLQSAPLHNHPVTISIEIELEESRRHLKAYLEILIKLYNTNLN